jgi:hemolysin III
MALWVNPALGAISLIRQTPLRVPGGFLVSPRGFYPNNNTTPFLAAHLWFGYHAAMNQPGIVTTCHYSFREEVAHSITHGVGFFLSIAALIVLVVLASYEGDPWRIVSFSLYGASLILLYGISTLYHSIPYVTAKRVLRLLDHMSIYVLIAGTYMPFVLVPLRGPWGWSLFGTILGLAMLGIAFKLIHGHRYEVFSVIVYLLMGWLVIVAIVPILKHVPTGGVIWLIGGGVAYTLGIAFYAWKKLPFNHAIWHLFVLAGSVCHFFAIYYYVLPVNMR